MLGAHSANLAVMINSRVIVTFLLQGSSPHDQGNLEKKRFMGLWNQRVRVHNDYYGGEHGSRRAGTGRQTDMVWNGS